MAMAAKTRAFSFKRNPEVCEPLKRIGHSSNVISNKAYIWGGSIKQPKQSSTKGIDVFDLQQSCWENIPVTGNGPKGEHLHASTVIGSSLYYFGGYLNETREFQNTLHRLNTENPNLTWEEVRVVNPDFGPVKKRGCGMLSFRCENEDFIFVVGGFGREPVRRLRNFQYLETDKHPGLYRNNEQHIFSLKTGKWSVPEVKGDIPPPSTVFTITAIDDKRALMFGGHGNSQTGFVTTDSLYMVELSAREVTWRKLTRMNRQRWPCPREAHAAMSLTDPFTGTNHLIISGGKDDKNKNINDCWSWNVQMSTWQKLDHPKLEVHRQYHTFSPFILGPRCAWGMVFGGIEEDLTQGKSKDHTDRYMNDTAILELVLGDSEGQRKWSIGNFLDKRITLDPQQNKDHMLQQLLIAQHDSKDLMEKLKVEMEERIEDRQRDLQQTVLQVREQLSDSRRENERIQNELTEIRERNVELTREVQDIHTRLAASNTAKEEVENNLTISERQLRSSQTQVADIRRQLQRKTESETRLNRQFQLQSQTLTTVQRELRDQRERLQELEHQSHEQRIDLERLKIEPANIVLTPKVLGKGSYGEVREAYYIGVKVAAKYMHEILASEYNSQLFQREMDIAASVHHPNLVQFFGHSEHDSRLLIITELMDMTLSDAITKKMIIPRNEVVSLMCEIAGALQYLHTLKPHPVIHRDVSSNNVLLKQNAQGSYNAKLADLGMANFMNRISPTTASRGSILYIAPEAFNPHEQSTKMDVYSFGVLLLEVSIWEAPAVVGYQRDEQLRHVSVNWPEMGIAINRCFVYQQTLRLDIEKILFYFKSF